MSCQTSARNAAFSTWRRNGSEADASIDESLHPELEAEHTPDTSAVRAVRLEQSFDVHRYVEAALGRCLAVQHVVKETAKRFLAAPVAKRHRESHLVAPMLDRFGK